MNKDIPTIATERLILRPPAMDDAPVLFSIMGEPGIMKYFPNTNAPSFEKVENMLEHQLIHWHEHGVGWWVITLNDTVIGWNGLYFLSETNETEVGYLLSKAQWGNGYATESTLAALNYGFGSLNKQEIVGLTHPENLASQRVLINAGMQFTNKATYFGMEMFRHAVKSVNFKITKLPTDIS